MSQCAEKDIATSTPCEFCPKSFSRQYIYFKHASTAHVDLVADNWMKCSQCDFYFPTSHNLERHVFMAHEPKQEKPAANRVLCTFCNLSLYESVQYYKHANMKHLELVQEQWVACEVCAMYFPTPEVLAYHKASAHRSEEKSFDSDRLHCDFCSLTFSRMQRYIQHCNKKHISELENTWLRCGECHPTAYFPSQKVLKNHHRIAHTRIENKNDPTFSQKVKHRKCPFCPREIYNTDSYLKHVNKEHPDLVSTIWHLCVICQFHYPTEKALKRHSSVMHKNQKHDAIPTPPPTTTTRSTTTEFKCQFCLKKFMQENMWAQHANDEHLGEICRKWRHICIRCNMYYPSNALLQDHNALNHAYDTSNQSAIHCHFCPDEVDNFDAFIAHANESHREEIATLWVSCDFCGSHFPSGNDLQKHVKSSHSVKMEEDYDEDDDDEYQGIMPEVRLEEYSEPSEPEDDDRSHHTRESRDSDTPDEESMDYEPIEVKLEPVDEESLTSQDQTPHSALASGKDLSCKTCGKTFEKKEYLRKHNYRVHKNHGDASSCDICGRSFKVKLELTRHKLRVHGLVDGDQNDEENDDEILTCEICGKEFEKRVNLRKHIRRIHSDVPKAKCTICNKKFRLSVELKRHTIRMHKIDPEDPVKAVAVVKEEVDDASEAGIDPDLDSVPSENGQFKCSECGKFYEKLEYLRKHKKRLHVEHVRIDCNMCTKSFNMTAELSRHQRRVHFRVNTVICELCNKPFADNFSLKTHVESIHAQIKYDCALCGKSFSSLSYLKRHTELVHLKSRSFECEHCGLGFSENHVLKRHILSVHLKHRNFECDKCGQTFSENHVLKRHIQSVHLKQRNHECEHCGRSFSESHVLKRHIQAVHLKQRNYNCEICGLTFSENHVLKRHLMVHSKQDEKDL